MIFTQYPNDFWHKRKINNFDPYNVLLTISTNIPMQLIFVVQGHIFNILNIGPVLKITEPFGKGT